MAIQGFFTGDVKIRDLNGVLRAVDGIVEVTPADVYVPYTGATGNVDLGFNALSAGVLNIIGNSAGAAGYLGLRQDIGITYAGVNYTSLTAEDKSYLAIYFAQTGFDYKLARLSVAGLTSNIQRTYSFPDSSGTLALISDIQTGYVPYTGATGPVNLGAYDLTVQTLTIGKGNSGLSNNTALGYRTLFHITTGNYNTAVGYESSHNTTTGQYNTSLGQSALFTNTTGSQNTAIGLNALLLNTTGGSNVVVGLDALQHNTTGSSNTALGYNAGSHITGGSTPNTTASSSVYIGRDTKAKVDGGSNEIVIGYNAIGNGSNTATFGNTSTTANYFTGSINGGSFVKNGGTSAQFLKADGSVDSSSYITLASLSASSPLSYNNGTGVFSISQASGSANGYLSSTDWNTFNNKQGTLTLTTTGTSGAATLVGTTLNIPNYGGGLTGYVPYIGATADVNLGVYTLSANSINIIGPGVGGFGGGYLGLKQSASILYGGGGYTSLTGEDKMYLSMYFSQDSIGTNYKLARFNVNALTNNTQRTYSLPDASGTIALTSNLTGYLTAVTASSPLFSSGGTTPNITIQVANTSQNGYLSSTDWNTFNDKQAAGSYITALTGEATASGPGSASVTLSTSAVTGKILTGLNLTGGGTIADTDSILQAFGKVQNQISGLAGGVTYQGVWNASTNTPTLTSSVGTKGYYYIVDVAGSTNLNGITDWKVGDWAIFNGSTWDKVDNTDAVSSVNGFTGAVSLTTSNIAEGTNLYYLDSRARLALSFTAGSGAYDNTTGVITIPTNTNQLTNGANFISLSSLSASSPLSYNNLSGDFSIQVANGSQNGYLSSTDWTTFNGKQAALNGSGFVKISGTTISYDSSTYLTTSAAASTYLPLVLSSSVYTVDINGQQFSIFGSASGYTSGRVIVDPLFAAVGYQISGVFDGLKILTDGSALFSNSGTTRFMNAVRFDSTLTNGTYTYTLPGATGTLALTSSLSAYVPYTGATANVDLGTYDLTADFITGSRGSYTSSGSSDTLGITHSSGSGIALNITKGGSGEGLYINKTSGSGNAATIIGTLNATTLVKSGGTSTQFLKADGSVDSNTYLTASSLTGYVPYTGATGSLNLGTNNITSQNSSLDGNGTTTGGFYGIKQYSSSNSGAQGYTSLYALAQNSLYIRYSQTNGTAKNVELSSALLGTTIRQFLFPDASGTLALTSDIPSLSGYVQGTGTTNYLPKFTGTSTIGNSLLVDNGTNLTYNGEELIINKSGGAFLTLLSGDTDTQYIQFKDTGGASASIRYNHSTNAMIFKTNGSDYLTLNASGNLGLGVTPSAWSLGKAFEVGNLGNGIWNYGVSNTNIVTNAIWNSGHKYASNGAATQYAQNNGNHEWLTAAAGTAGNAISFTQAMTLNASGNLSIGNTNDTYKLDVSGTGRFTGKLIVSANIADVALDIVNTNTTNGYGLAVRGGVGSTSYALNVINAANTIDLFTVMGSGAATFSSSVTAGANFRANNGGFESYDSSYNLSMYQNVSGGTGGLYSSSNNAMAFWTNSTERMRITSGGNVGIGMSSPSYKLDINLGSSYVRAYNNAAGWNFYALGNFSSGGQGGIYTGAGYVGMFSDGAYELSLGYNNARTMNFTSGGNVGIGTTSPDIFGRFYTQTLGISSSGSTAIQINGGSGSYGQIDFGAGGVRTAGISASANETQWGSVTAIPAIIYTNGSERMRITSGGNVGIGTTSPISVLDVQVGPSTRRFLVNYDDSIITIKGGSSNGAPESLRIIGDGIRFNVGSSGSGSEAVRITGAGSVGIGTTSPSTKFVVSNGGAGGIEMQGNSSVSGGAFLQTYNRSTNAFFDFDIVADNMIFRTGQSYAERLRITSGGNVGIGTTSPSAPLTVNSNGETKVIIQTSNPSGNSDVVLEMNGNYYYNSIIRNNSAGAIAFQTGTTERMRITSGGKVCINTTTVNNGAFLNIGSSGSSRGDDLMTIFNPATYGIRFLSATGGGSPNTSVAHMLLGNDGTTGRSINASGTINASGADYAEYMTKAIEDNISKGDIVGVDKNGLLTNIYEDAISFVVKSTDPSYVGGDNWCQKLEGAELEKARQKVDRVAFSGQVPCNVLNAKVGDYIIPINVNGKIKGQAITDPTLEQYRISVGKVWKVMEDGRAWIAVKIG